MAPIPQATAAAAPPDEPPGVTPASKGLSVRPCNALSVNQRTDMAGALLRPTITAPAAFSEATSGESLSARLSLSATSPSVVGRPAVSTLILMVTGTPCSGPSGSPRARAASSASAVARASFAITSAMALMRGFTASMRVSTLSVASRAPTSPARMRAASSAAPRVHSGSLMAALLTAAAAAG